MIDPADSLLAHRAAPVDGDLMLGIGCERETPTGLLERGIEKVLADHGLSAGAVRAIATIDKKRDEPGLLALAERRNWPLWFYSAEELRDAFYLGSPARRSAATEGSDLVDAHVSTPAVAEPAARLLAGADELLIAKTIYTEEGAGRSMTIAVARRNQGSRA
ncbi:MAG: cbiG [Myxococcaceae bacterium]|nr:cbiG [Myxococcaceae bacterium]